MIHYLEKDEKYLKEEGIKLKKCISVEGETFKKIEKNNKNVEQIFYYYNRYYTTKGKYKGYIKCKNSYIILLNLKIKSNFYKRNYKKMVNYLYSYKSNIYYQWINKKAWGKVKNFNYLNYDKIRKGKYNVYYIPIKNFHNNFIKLYKKILKNQMYTFDWIYLSLTSILLKEYTFNDLKNYFICILKKKKTYKKYIKYTIEFMLHIHEIDIEYMYLMNKNDPYFTSITEYNPSYYSKWQFYERLNDCDIIKKGETLKDVYLKYIYENEKKRTVVIKEAKKKKKS